MKLIKILDEKNYDKNWGKFERTAVRAIIFCDGLLAMIKSEKYGEYKFLGGGIKNGEMHTDTLVREVMEEAGLVVKPETITPYGKILEMRKGYEEDVIFIQQSYYYNCKVTKERFIPTFDDDYEIEYGYKPVFVTVDEAIKANEKLLNQLEVGWAQRDLIVLYKLKEQLLVQR
ncbi:MAG: NUDIX domain-containing protein [Defluviitaleaceae bacterium]|nr:NUDIX domain-containing protein [Defluviitaleaceae bacterium]